MALKHKIKFLWLGFLVVIVVLGLILVVSEKEKQGQKTEETKEQEIAKTSDEFISQKGVTSDEGKREEIAKVLHVFDGDTFSARINGKTEKIRLIGIDAPETGEKYTKKECFAGESKEKAIELLATKTVRLEADLTQNDKDKYDRLLRYVFLEDGTLFNLLLIKQGFAEEYTFQNKVYKFQSDFLSAQTSAKDAKLGLWGKCNQ